MQCPVTVLQHPISKRWATPAAKHKKQSKFMELLSDVISSTATSSADKTCEEKHCLNCTSMWMILPVTA